MDQGTAVKVGVAAMVAVVLFVGYVVRGSRLRETKRRIREYLAEYFNGDVTLDQLIRRSREGASPSFMGSPECQALVQAAFQRAPEAKLAREGHRGSLDQPASSGHLGPWPPEPGRPPSSHTPCGAPAGHAPQLGASGRVRRRVGQSEVSGSELERPDRHRGENGAERLSLGGR